MTYENPNVLDTITENLLNVLLYPRLFRRYAPMLSLGTDECILEVGSGGGAMTRQLAKATGDGTMVTCVDLLDFWLERARKRMRGNDGITFLSGDIADVALPCADYSLVFIHFMFHDVPARKRSAIAHRLAGLLANGGRLFICEPTKPSHGMPAREIDAVFEEAGLKKREGIADSAPVMGAMYRVLFEKE